MQLCHFFGHCLFIRALTCVSVHLFTYTCIHLYKSTWLLPMLYNYKWAAMPCIIDTQPLYISSALCITVTAYVRVSLSGTRTSRSRSWWVVSPSWAKRRRRRCWYPARTTSPSCTLAARTALSCGSDLRLTSTTTAGLTARYGVGLTARYGVGLGRANCKVWCRADCKVWCRANCRVWCRAG